MKYLMQSHAGCLLAFDSMSQPSILLVGKFVDYQAGCTRLVDHQDSIYLSWSRSLVIYKLFNNGSLEHRYMLRNSICCMRLRLVYHFIARWGVSYAAHTFAGWSITNMHGMKLKDISLLAWVTVPRVQYALPTNAQISWSAAHAIVFIKMQFCSTSSTS